MNNGQWSIFLSTKFGLRSLRFRMSSLYSLLLVVIWVKNRNWWGGRGGEVRERGEGSTILLSQVHTNNVGTILSRNALKIIVF